jgi:hypothetical protein
MLKRSNEASSLVALLSSTADLIEGPLGFPVGVDYRLVALP